MLFRGFGVVTELFMGWLRGGNGVDTGVFTGWLRDG